MVTKTPSDEYVFKVPTLRNITLTAPYFHTGQAWDLRQAVAVMGTSQLGTQLTGDEVDKITAFLESLTGEQPRVTYPILPPGGAGTPRPEPYDREGYPINHWCKVGPFFSKPCRQRQKQRSAADRPDRFCGKGAAMQIAAADGTLSRYPDRAWSLTNTQAG
jgi:hypothetical protein